MSAEARTLELTHGGSPEQLAFWASPSRFRGFVGGVGSGKSRAGAVEVLRQPAGSTGMVVAPTYKMLRQATLDSFLEVARPVVVSLPDMPDLDDEDIDLISEWNKSEQEIRLATGMTIYLRSAELPDNLRGPSLGWFWLDEAAMMDAIVWSIMIGRLRREPERGWLTTTPRGFNWIHNEFVAKRDPDYHVIRSHTRSNPFISESYKRSLERNYDPRLAKQELAGEFVEWVNTPCYVMERAVHAEAGLRRKVYDPRMPLLVCCDFNVRYMCWPIAQEPGGQPRVIDYVESMPASIPTMVAKLRDKYPAHPGGLVVYGDATGRSRSPRDQRSIYDELRLELMDYPGTVEFRVPAANPPVIERIRCVNRLLRGRGGEVRLLVDADCGPVIEDLIQTEWAASGTVEQQWNDSTDVEKLKRSHASAALGYWLYRQHPLTVELRERKAEQERTEGKALKIRRRRLVGGMER